MELILGVSNKGKNYSHGVRCATDPDMLKAAFIVLYCKMMEQIFPNSELCENIEWTELNGNNTI